MPISSTTLYRLIYAQIPFLQHTSFLQGLRSRFPSLEIPYLDAGQMSDSAREAVDQYLYVRDDPDAAKTLAAIKAAASRGRAFPGRLDELGVVPGRDVAAMLERFRIEQEGTAEVGGYYRIQNGFHRNLIVQVMDKGAIEEVEKKRPAVISKSETNPPGGREKPINLAAAVVVEYSLFGRRRTLVVEKSNLLACRAPVDPDAGFTNYVTTAREKRAVILDADTELREACCRCDNLYTRPEPGSPEAKPGSSRKWGRYVGGSQGFYFTLSRFRLLYPEYELHVVFDEREGGPRASEGSDSFQAAYLENREWVKRFVRACGLHVYEIPGARSEDVIASLVKRMEGDLDYRDIRIATKGTDLFALVSEKTRLSLPKINFRDHPQTITPREALQKFGLSDESQLNRIYWLRALTGDVAGTPSVNQYNKGVNHRYTNIRQVDFLPHVLSATHLMDLKLRLLTFEAFHPFLHSGQFDRNLARLTLDQSRLDDAVTLDCYRATNGCGTGVLDPEAIRGLLEANAFHKEVEYLPWSLRVIAGLW